jgi:dipeptidyl aminopeptidase/acylaminoacyl peptidase
MLLSCPVHAAKRRFTVADDIGFSRFAGHYKQVPDVIYSPDGKYFAVETERGSLEQNRPESTIRIYRVENVQSFLVHRDRDAPPPNPIWTISRATYKNAPIITDLRWLADSSGIAFLLATESGSFQLFIADLNIGKVSELTPADVNVRAYAIRDRKHYVYVSLSPAVERAIVDSGTLGVNSVATGHDLESLLSPVVDRTAYDLCELWAVIDGRKFRVNDALSGRPIVIHHGGTSGSAHPPLALAPDGNSLVTVLPVEDVPKEWETLYPPPLDSSPFRVKRGLQDVNALLVGAYVNEYVSIDLTRGRVAPLTGAPTGAAAGWDYHQASADWSVDGRQIVVTNSFVGQAEEGAQRMKRPCVLVVHLDNHKIDCVEPVKGDRKLETGYGREEGFNYIQRAYFRQGLNDSLTVDYMLPDGSEGARTYNYSQTGQWTISTTTDKWADNNPVIESHVDESFTEPPVLVATNKATGDSGVILDPNPEFKDIDLGQASIYRWRDKSGREWIGGLYTPTEFVPGRRYPLVIQTHGFLSAFFAPSGLYSTAYAARELAGAGILVLQVPDCQPTSDSVEIVCAVAEYEAAIQQLIADGLVDSARVGIMGFSRTCMYVTQTLTTSKVPISAASISDGVMSSYWQYLGRINFQGNGFAREQEGIIGAAPVGEGLDKWLERAAGFNFHRINTPLQVVAIGPTGVLFMWEPYSVLRYLHKPVDLVWLREGEHDLSNPAMRMVSQGGSVDWFRFWLKSEEDPDPAKADQYIRWREMRRLQQQQPQRQH